MKLPTEVLPYLRGEKFSNALAVSYSYKQPIPNRVELLTQLSVGKKIVHLGCLDHLPLIDEKVKNGQWLHKRITEQASKCIGIDINRETNEYVRQRYGINNVVICDITAASIPEIIQEQWDYAILGELLEHIDNPVDYLASIRETYHGHVDQLIITVPNAFTRENFRQSKRSVEKINSDHRYWFTPYTLSKVMLQAGIEVTEIKFANRIRLTKGELIHRKMLTLFGQQPVYGFDHASSIVGIGKL